MQPRERQRHPLGVVPPLTRFLRSRCPSLPETLLIGFFRSVRWAFWIHLQCERFESAKARAGSPFGAVVQIQIKGANEDHTLKSLEFVSQSLYFKDARKKIKRLLAKPATVRVSACVRHSCMHLQRALRLSIWSGCENVQTSFAWSKISRSSLPDAGMQQAECIWCCLWRPLALVSKYIQAPSHPHQISSFQFARCRRAFPNDRLLAWSEVKMSSHNHSMPFNRLMRVSCYRVRCASLSTCK